MVITFQGGNYFKIQSGEFSVLIDPSNARSLKGSSIVLNTLKPPMVEGEPDNGYIWIENQGEYEVQGVPVTGYHVEYEGGVEKTAYVFVLEGIRIAVFGNMTKDPKPELLENMEKIDVLIIPGGGKPYLAENSAAKIVRQLEPCIIIPSLFNSHPKKFFGELSQNPSIEEKLVLKKKDLSPNAMKIVYLSEK